MIHYVQRHIIDVSKWDACIEASSNSLVYAYSSYLDAMSDHWDALIMGDYEYVMPLTWRKKIGTRYLYPPPFTQQGGVFSRQVISPELVKEFLTLAATHFPFGDIYLNYASPMAGLQKHCNYILPLNTAYTQLTKGYKKDLQNNLKIADRHNLNYASGTNPLEVTKLFKNRYASQIGSIDANGFTRFENLILGANRYYHSIVRLVTSGANELLAAALLVVSGKRLYLIESYVSDDGRKMSANHFLLDRLIHEHSSGDWLLDFEGSDIPGIARFYANFGAVDQPYYFYHYNHLPLIQRKVKQLVDKLKGR